MDDRRQGFPVNAACFQIAATTTASASAVLAVGNDVRIVNEGPNNVYVSVGIGAQAATLPGGAAAQTCTPILAGTDIVLGLPSSIAACQISAITATGTAALDIQVGEGQ